MINFPQLAKQLCEIDYSSKVQLTWLKNNIEQELQNNLELILTLRGQPTFEAIYKDFDITRGFLVRFITLIKDRLREIESHSG